MKNTTFSILLQGLHLPDDVKDKLQSELRSVVLSEIAKTDLGKEVSVRPLPKAPERVSSDDPVILGFAVRKLAQLTERSSQEDPFPPFAGIPRPLPYIPDTCEPDPYKPIFVSALKATTASTLPFDGASFAEVLEAVYFRPDIRAAIASNSQAFAELLSRNEEATRAFDQLTGGLATQSEIERLGPLAVVGIVAAAAAAGAAMGWLQPRPK